MIKIGYEPYLECSSKGDKRFSAFYARIKRFNNKSIEEIYQSRKVYRDEKTGMLYKYKNFKDNKGKKAINMDEVAILYDRLWYLYLKENPELIEVLKKYNGYSDIFGKEGCQCQAKSIYKCMQYLK